MRAPWAVIFAVGAVFLLFGGLYQAQSQEAPRCDGVVMSPGDLCHRPDGRINTYEQEIAVNQTAGWIPVGAAFVCGIMAVILVAERDKY